MSKHLLDTDELREKLRLLMRTVPLTWKEVSDKAKISMTTVARWADDDYDKFTQNTLRKVHNFIMRYTPKWKS